MGRAGDINTIRCYLDLSENGNNELFSFYKIYTELSKKVGSYLEEYGLQYEIIPPGGKGGGGGEIALWELLKFVLKNWDLIGFIIIFLKFIIRIPKFLISLLDKITSLTRPKIYISLNLETNEDYADWYFNQSIGKKLINLKYLSDDFCNRLSKDYPIFRFDQSFGIFIQPRKFSLQYSLPAEQQNKINTLRLIRLFKSIKIRNNTFSNYNFTKWFAISRSDGKLDVEDSTRIKSAYKKYYLFFSTRIISDYF